MYDLCNMENILEAEERSIIQVLFMGIEYAN